MSDVRSRHFLFVLLHPGFIRHYASTLATLSANGHRVTLTFESARNKIGEQAQLVQLQERAPAIEIVPFPQATRHRWHYLAMAVRLLQDYARYFDPRFHQAEALRARAAEQLPAALDVLCRAACRWEWTRRSFGRLLRFVERAIPPNPAIHRFIAGLAPDALLVTPLVDWASDQVHCLKSAAALGIPSALCVASWDNLTNKGAVRFTPTRVIVWNEAQRREAVDLHGVPADRVTVTGAQTFDHWFARTAARSRQEFLEALDLDPAERVVLYLGSSFFIAPDEAQFFDRFLRAMRQSADARLANAGVIVRPHPLNIQQWLAFDFTSLGRVAVFPKRVGVEAFSESFRADFFDSLSHADVAIGVNTSAMIEAGIVGLPVLTVLAPEFRHSQAGTMHFQHLTSEAGGVARTMPDIPEALAGIVEAFDHRETFAAQARRFIASFVRPRGWDVPAATHLHDELLRLAATRAAALAPVAGAPFVRLLLWPPALLATRLLRSAEKKPRRKGPLGAVDGAIVRAIFILAMHVAAAMVWVWVGLRSLTDAPPYVFRHARRLVKRGPDGMRRQLARTAKRLRTMKTGIEQTSLRKMLRRLERGADLRAKALRRTGQHVARAGRRVPKRLRHMIGRLRNAGSSS